MDNFFITIEILNINVKTVYSFLQLIWISLYPGLSGVWKRKGFRKVVRHAWFLAKEINKDNNDN